MRPRHCGDAEVTADVSDDVRDRAMVDIVIEVRSVQPVEEFGVQGLGFRHARGALDGVFDLANDAPAGSRAVLGGVLGDRYRFGDFSRQDNAAPDGPRNAIERLRKIGRRLGTYHGDLSLGLLMQQAGQVGADVDQAVQDPAVVLRILGRLVGGVLWLGRAWLEVHERNMNENATVCQC
jgi:hypothetical protein